jgi:hypothetical protein
MNSTREFRPEEVSRRGEAVTWVLVAISLATLVALRFLNADVSLWQITFTLLMVLAAAGMTLGNWMERNTVLILKPDGVHFRNGLRDVTFTWDQIQQVQVSPTRLGKQVHIVGDHAHFNFRTMVEVIHKGKTQGVIGFAGGDFIIDQILKNSSLREIDQAENGHYYARL